MTSQGDMGVFFNTLYKRRANRKGEKGRIFLIPSELLCLEAAEMHAIDYKPPAERTTRDL